MPLEINEIGISVRVTGNHAESQDGSREDSGQEAEERREELIEECIRRVLLALKLERER